MAMGNEGSALKLSPQSGLSARRRQTQGRRLGPCGSHLQEKWVSGLSSKPDGSLPGYPAGSPPAHRGCSRCPLWRSGPRSRRASGLTGRARAGSSPPGSAAPRRCPRSSPARPRSRCSVQSSVLCRPGRRGDTAGKDVGGRRAQSESGLWWSEGQRVLRHCLCLHGVKREPNTSQRPGFPCEAVVGLASVRGCSLRVGKLLWSLAPPDVKGQGRGDSPCAYPGLAQPSCRPGGSSGCSRPRSEPVGQAGSKRDWGRPWRWCSA